MISEGLKMIEYEMKADVFDAYLLYLRKKKPVVKFCGSSLQEANATEIIGVPCSLSLKFSQSRGVFKMFSKFTLLPVSEFFLLSSTKKSLRHFETKLLQKKNR